MIYAVEAVAAELGRPAVRACRHRLEHVEMIDPADIDRMRDLGMVASVQPAFDAAWGGDAGMYAERLGVERALATNPFAGLADAGVALALGSDAPVTPLDPWGGVHAAVDHRTPGSGLRPVRRLRRRHPRRLVRRPRRAPRRPARRRRTRTPGPLGHRPTPCPPS